MMMLRCFSNFSKKNKIAPFFFFLFFLFYLLAFFNIKSLNHGEMKNYDNKCHKIVHNK